MIEAEIFNQLSLQQEKIEALEKRVEELEKIAHYECSKCGSSVNMKEPVCWICGEEKRDA